MSRILIVGEGKGSWQIRGRQLGAAIGAVWTSKPTRADWRRADLVVLVKRAIETRSPQRKQIVWDALDYWAQPDENALPMAAHIARALTLRDEAGVSLVICATQAMADDLGGVYLPHHSRPGLVATSVRQVAHVVAYEGTPKYLGSWRQALGTACAKLGLTFVINPPNLADADIVVALRGEQWDGAVCRRWKSGVKYVNAIAAGRPVITQASAAWDELQPSGCLVERPDELEHALQSLLPADVRQRCFAETQRLAPRYTLVNIAHRYREILQDCVRRAA